MAELVTSRQSHSPGGKGWAVSGPVGQILVLLNLHICCLRGSLARDLGRLRNSYVQACGWR